MNPVPNPPPPSHPLPHLVWDWNGTLSDDTQAFVNALNRELAVRGLPPMDAERYRDTFDFPVRDFYRTLGIETDDACWQALSLNFHAGLHADTTVRLRSGSVAVLEILHAQAVPMSILSALEQSRLEQALTAHRIERFFRHVRGAPDLNGHSKLETARALARDLPHAPEDIWLIGDTTHDHAVANAMGWKCLLVADGHHSRRRLESCGRPVLDSLPELFARIPAFDHAAPRE